MWNPFQLVYTRLASGREAWWFGEYFDVERDGKVQGWIVSFQAVDGAGIRHRDCPFVRVLLDYLPVVTFFDFQQPLYDDTLEFTYKDNGKKVFRLIASRSSRPSLPDWDAVVSDDGYLPMLIRDGGSNGYVAALLEYGGTCKWLRFIEKLRDEHEAVEVASVNEMPVW
jgi:hypothetical protein